MRISADITNKHAENHPIRIYFSARLENALRFANAVGALTTTQRGAIPALPVKADVERFLRDLE